MGGKHKQAQRTKNNARPSSSGRSAELLRNTTTFVGFTTVKDGSTAILPGFSLNPDEVDTQGNSEFNLVMKKMYKKDSTTKLKALQEFADLCKRSDVNEIKGALPQWPHIYNLLAMDADHRVREASHQAQRQLAVAAKKNLAPYLKALSGPWFTGMYDTYAPAASTARQAFQDAFPPPKTVEAITFCQEEIFNFIFDNLVNQTANTLSNSKNSSAEEMEAKYTRILISSLQGYSYFLHQLPTKVLKTSEQNNQKLVSSSKFWKYARHISPLVRSSWFSALIAICQKAPFLLEDQGSHVAHAVFGNLDEADPGTLPVVWEAALHALVTIKDCWSHVDPHKVVFPKLWHVLKEGGQGNASTIYPNLLPLLSKIPRELLSDKELFYKRFFNNMREGFNQASVQLSQSESNAVSVTFIECLRYTVMVHQDDETFCSFLLINQLIPVLKDSFAEKKWKLHLRPLYSQMSSLVHHWHRNTSESSCFEVLTKIFWEQVTDVIAESAQENQDAFAFMSRNQLEFILYLKDPSRQKKKENLKVGFVDCEEEKRSMAASDLSETAISEVSDCKNAEKHLINLVLETCEEYSSGASVNSSCVFVDAMSNLVLEFNSDELVSHLVQYAKREDNNAFSLEKLLSWLHDPSMCTSNVVKVLFLILVRLDPEEKTSILTSMLELKNLLILQWCLIDAVNFHGGDGSVRKWLKNPQLSEIIVNIVRDISTNSLSIGGAGDTEAFQTTWDVLKCCFSKTSDGDFPVAMDTLISIVKVLSDGMSPKISPNVTKADPNSSARFVGELACALFSRESKSSVPLTLILLGKGDDSIKSPAAGSVLCDLALSMFTTCCIGHHHASVLQTSTLSLLGNAWQTLVSSMALALGIGNNVGPFMEVTEKFAKATWMSISPLNGVASLEVASMKAVAFIKATLEACTNDDVLSKETVLANVCEGFFNHGTSSPDTLWCSTSNELIMQMCLAAELLRNCTNLQKEVIVEEGQPEKFLQSISVSIFIINVLSNVGKHCGYLEEESTEEVEGISDDLCKIEVEENRCQNKDGQEELKKKRTYGEFLLKFLDHLTKALNIFSLCKLFLLHFKNDPLSLKINPRYKLLKSNLKTVIALMGDGGVQQLNDRLISQVEEYNGQGLWTIRFLYSELLTGKDMFSVFADLKSNSSLSQYHVQMIQIFSSLLPKEEFEEIASESAKTLHSYSNVVQEDGDALIEIWPNGYLSIVVCALRSMAIPWNEGEDKKMENSVKTALESILLTRQSGISSIFTKDMSLWTYRETSAAVEVADFLEGCVKNCRKMLSPNQWDLLLCSMVAWVHSLASTSEKHINIEFTRKSWWHSVDHASLAASIFRLVATVVGTIEGHGYNSVEGSNVDDKETVLVSSCLPEDLISEWHDVYADEIYHPLIRMFSLMTDCKLQRNTSWSHLENLLFEDTVKALRVIPAKCLSKCPFPCLLTYESSNKVSFLASDLVATLRSPVIPLQTAAYLLILKLVPDLIEEDKKILSTEGSDSEKVYEKLSCHLLEDQLSEAQSVVDTMLMDFRVGDSCTVQPFTDTYTYTSAYFLQWKVILEMCRVAEPELRCHYAQWLKDTGHLSSLLHNVFRLLPDQLLQGCSIQVNSPSSKMLSRLFESKLAAQAYYGAVTTENLERLICWVWVDTFRYLPALVRYWWNDLEARSNSLVERLTTVYLSPLLCAEEMRAVQAEEKTFSNMMIKVHHTAREVVAIYSVDDAEAELLIQLPTNHPLGLVKVESGKYLFGTNQSHNWRRQITIFLNYQNGSIWDGLALWKKYLDRRFEGVEECFICYSILHNSNYQIPKLSCHTCKKKFHSQCLYKWFSTSNNSTCPICRNLWKY